jgi:tRNA threonylcarbamoyladenosine biosynthesis protein TsaE
MVSTSPEATRLAGARLGARLRPGDVVAMIGELGAGKTCFVQGLVQGLGASTEATSPTFVMVNQYRGRHVVHHVDAYRAGTMTELLDLGLDEMLGGDGVTVIEWADRLLPLLPPGTVTVRISGLGDEPREIVVEEPGDGSDPGDPVSHAGH